MGVFLGPAGPYMYAKVQKGLALGLHAGLAYSLPEGYGRGMVLPTLARLVLVVRCFPRLRQKCQTSHFRVEFGMKSAHDVSRSRSYLFANGLLDDLPVDGRCIPSLRLNLGSRKKNLFVVLEGRLVDLIASCNVRGDVWNCCSVP